MIICQNAVLVIQTCTYVQIHAHRVKSATITHFDGRTTASIDLVQ